MKSREGYVSNSSSSSFLISYDKNVFGDLGAFFSSFNEDDRTETHLGDLGSEVKRWLNPNLYDTKKEKIAARKIPSRIRKAQDEGRDVIALWIDYNSAEMISLLKSLDRQKSGKFEIIASCEPFETILPDYHDTI